MELPQLKIYRQSKRHFLVVPFPSMYRTIFVSHDGDELPGMSDVRMVQIFLCILCWLLPSLRRILLPLLRFLYEVSSSSLPRRGIPLGTSVQEIGILHAIEHASLPKHRSCEYNQHRPFCSYSLARCLFSRR